MERGQEGWTERRSKWRFTMHRELRYRVLDDDCVAGTGAGSTMDVSSAGVAFFADRPVVVGCFVELSISWPVLLDDSCPMRLIVFGRVVRTENSLSVCSVEKYEFRTQARGASDGAGMARSDAMLQRWVDSLRKEYARPAARTAGAAV